MKIKALLSAVILAALALQAQAQVTFAWMSDLHYVPGAPSEQSTRQCIADINHLQGADKPDFVIVNGDLTDFGKDDQLYAIKKELDALNCPYYVVAGNHDSKWSESGCNTVIKAFGYENFCFEQGGWRFVGCASGPDMRMAPALVPRHHMNWLAAMAQKDRRPTIFINHYPLDSMVLNYGEVRREIRRMDARVALGGHIHRDKQIDYGGVPGITCRSTLVTKGVAGYNIVTIQNDTLKVYSRRLTVSGQAVEKAETAAKAWCVLPLKQLNAEEPLDPDGLPADYPWLKYDVNAKYTAVTELWRYADEANIATGFALEDTNRAFYATETGTLRCIDPQTGKQLWSAQLPGKVFSTPACSKGRVVVGCADNGVYCYKASNGKLLWKAETEKSVLSSPAIHNGIVFFGTSDGHFRAVKLKNGKDVWSFNEVESFVECRPYVDAEVVIFGSWGRTLYCLDTKTGNLKWKTVVEKGSVMYSPAACNPVRVGGRVFVAEPDRQLHVYDMADGRELATAAGGRESLGSNGSAVYAKVMNGTVYRLEAAAPIVAGAIAKTWQSNVGMGYDISPTELLPVGPAILVPTDKGNLYALSQASGQLLWAHKISTGLVNPLAVVSASGGKALVLASTLDGTVTALEIKFEQ